MAGVWWAHEETGRARLTMCGILGVVEGEGGLSTPEWLPMAARGLERMAHRGPDGSGWLVFSPAESLAFVTTGRGGRTALPAPSSAPPDAPPGRLILGHNRLAILDPGEGGRQPMATPDGRHVLAYNGEITNHVELREELRARGHTFRSRSDTEVLLRAWVEWGSACLPRLEGMFAFALLDTRQARLVLARDPFGIKPLYLQRVGSSLRFASEIPPLLDLPGASRAVSPGALLDYLNEGVTDHGDTSLFHQIRQLPAAHLLEIPLDRPARGEPRPYWAPELGGREGIPFDEAARTLRGLFMESVAHHLRSDVPVGTLLSGGIDSSALVMAMREVAGPSLELHTFSYIAGPGAVNEEVWVDRVNEAAGATPHKVGLRPHQVPDALRRLAAFQGEPFGSVAVHAQARVLEEAARGGVKVVLDGQGADELLGGYTSMWADHLAGLMGQGRWGAAAAFLREAGGRKASFDPGRLEILGGALMRRLPRMRTLLRLAAGRDLSPLISRPWWLRHRLGAPRRETAPGAPPLASALWRAVRVTSLPALLRYEERSSMAVSLEARLPFLTPKIASFALSLPPGHLIAPDGTGKSVLRAALKGLVPGTVLERREKIGFSVPNRAWLALLPGMADLLAEALTIPAVDPVPMERALRSVREGRPLPQHLAMAAWRLIGLVLWARTFQVEFS